MERATLPSPPHSSRRHRQGRRPAHGHATVAEAPALGRHAQPGTREMSRAPAREAHERERHTKQAANGKPPGWAPTPPWHRPRAHAHSHAQGGWKKRIARHTQNPPLSFSSEEMRDGGTYAWGKGPSPDTKGHGVDRRENAREAGQAAPCPLQQACTFD
eukprot:scaffold34135_cov34-Tisochrysis_lutea.AAC.2